MKKGEGIWSHILCPKVSNSISHLAQNPFWARQTCYIAEFLAKLSRAKPAEGVLLTRLCRKARSDMLSGQVTLCHCPVQKRPNTLFQNLNSINADACNINYDSTPTHGSYGEGNGPLQFCRVNLLCILVRSNRGFVSKIQSITNLITTYLHSTTLTRSKSLPIHKPTKRWRNTSATATTAPRFTRLLVSLVAGSIPHPKSVHIFCLTQMAHKFTIKINTTQHNTTQPGGSNH